MIKCKGCGIVMQTEDPLKEGYTSDLNNKFCERCFRITHYNEYIKSEKKNEEYLKKIKYINNTGDLVIITVDFLNMIDLDKLKIKNKVILVVTKRDILPRSVFEDKFLKNIKTNLNVKHKMFISSKTNYNLDVLMEKIKEYKNSKNVYVIGLTNSGKSTLINKIVKNYTNYESDITVSNIPSTTLEFIPKKIYDDLYLIDTPGLLDKGSIILSSDKNTLKKIIPNKQIKPLIYQIKVDQNIIVEDIFRIDIPKDNILVFYMSNSLNVQRYYKDNEKIKNLKKYEINVEANEDLVIKGLGFINFKKSCRIVLYLKPEVSHFMRKSIN